jgi:hypothetical protein
MIFLAEDNKDNCLHRSCDEWTCLAKFTELEEEPNVHYVDIAFSFFDHENVHEALRGRDVFIKTALLLDHARMNVILDVSTELYKSGFMVHGNTLERPHPVIREIIGHGLLDTNADSKYHYIYPTSDRSLEVARLVDKVFFNLVNMEKVDALMPDMPRDVKQCVVDKMWKEPVISLPTLSPSFIVKCIGTRSRKAYRKILCEWFDFAYWSGMKSYLDDLY